MLFVAAERIVRHRDAPHHADQRAFLIDRGELVDCPREFEQTGGRVCFVCGFLGDGLNLFRGEVELSGE